MEASQVLGAVVLVGAGMLAGGLGVLLVARIAFVRMLDDVETVLRRAAVQRGMTLDEWERCWLGILENARALRWERVAARKEGRSRG